MRVITKSKRNLNYYPSQCLRSRAGMDEGLPIVEKSSEVHAHVGHVLKISGFRSNTFVQARYVGSYRSEAFLRDSSTCTASGRFKWVGFPI